MLAEIDELINLDRHVSHSMPRTLLALAAFNLLHSSHKDTSRKWKSFMTAPDVKSSLLEQKAADEIPETDSHEPTKADSG